MPTPASLLGLKRRTPFVPFRVTTCRGETFMVTHPSLVMVGVRELNIGTATARWPDVYERLDRVALTDITDVSDSPA